MLIAIHLYYPDNDVCPAPVDDGDVSLTTCDNTDNDGVCDLQCQSGASHISAPRPRYQPCGSLGVYDWKKAWKNLVLPTCAGNGHLSYYYNLVFPDFQKNFCNNSTKVIT